MSQETNKKYIILENETLEHNGRILYRIKAVKDFDDVKADDKGGWIEKERNLSQEGNCWVYDDSKVFDNACIMEDAKVFNRTEIFDNARVYGKSELYEDVRIYDNAQVFDKALITGNVEIYNNAWVFGLASIHDNSKVSDYAIICGKNNIYDNVHICGNVCIAENMSIKGDAVIKKFSDYNIFRSDWSSGQYFTYTKSNKMWSNNYFLGTGDVLIKKGYEESELSGKMYETWINLVNQQEKIKEEFSKKE